MKLLEIRSETQLRVALFGTLLLAGLLRLTASGWALFLFFIVYIAIWLLHLLAHERAIWHYRRSGYQPTRTIFASHLLFIVCTLVQTDFTDASKVMVFTSLIGIDVPPGWPINDLRENVLAYMPALATWIALLWQTRASTSAAALLLVAMGGLFFLYTWL